MKKLATLYVYKGEEGKLSLIKHNTVPLSEDIWVIITSSAVIIS